MCEKKGKPSTKKASPPLDESTLSPRAKALLEELSKEFKLSKETVADLARMMYRIYKDKA
jgi:hypothetical protein